jgi:hypothetical protein
MLRAYRAGLLKPDYKHAISSRIRENLILADIGAEQDMESALQQMHLKAAWAPLFSDPARAQKDMLARSAQFIAHGQGDPVAMLAEAAQEAQEENLRLLYKAMLDSGQLDPPNATPRRTP